MRGPQAPPTPEKRATLNLVAPSAPPTPEKRGDDCSRLAPPTASSWCTGGLLSPPDHGHATTTLAVASGTNGNVAELVIVDPHGAVALIVKVSCSENVPAP